MPSTTRAPYNPAKATPMPKKVYRRSIRETIEHTFEKLQKHEGLSMFDWASDNLGEFYHLAAKLIPKEVQHQGNISLDVSTGVPRIGRTIEAEYSVVEDETPSDLIGVI